jgi:glycerophosphoryl diester phosphodiesterase
MTLNIAHRGARKVAPENTIPAFTKAIELGADGIELDVQLSADDELFVLHDLTLNKTTNGTGVAANLPLAALKEFDAGGWFGEEWRATEIPELHEVFDALPDHAYVNIELKRDSIRDDGLEETITNFIRHRNIAHRVIVSSFNPVILWRLRHEPFPLGLLYAPDMPPGLAWGQARRFLRLDALHPHYSQVRAPLPTLPVNTWTVNNESEMRRLLALSVNAIITDVPDVLKTVITSS